MTTKNKNIYLTNMFNITPPSVSPKPYSRKYKRNLPHWEIADAIYFVTYRLAHSVPLTVIREIREEFKRQVKIESKVQANIDKKRLYKLRFEVILKIDNYLNNNLEIQYLANPVISKIVLDSILHFAVLYHDNAVFFQKKSDVVIIDNSNYHSFTKEIHFILYRWTIMPNHVHLLLRPLINPQTGKYYVLYKILQSIKKYSGRQANRILNKKGQFWHYESYDHIIRNQKEFNWIWNYIDYNAVKAGLANSGKEWPAGSDYFFNHI